jgi:hypothetical protein
MVDLYIVCAIAPEAANNDKNTRIEKRFTTGVPA